VAVDSGQSLKIEFSGQHEPHILRIFLPARPVRVTLDGSELAEADSWQFDAAHERLIIKTRNYAQGRYEIFTVPGASPSSRSAAPEKEPRR